MFCSHCGAKAQGNFCSQCGGRLAVAKEMESIDEKVDEPLFDDLIVDDEVSYSALMRRPGVRATIARHAAMCRKGMSGEEFLAKCDQVLPVGVPLEKIVAFVVPIYASWGIATGKTRDCVVDAAVQDVLLRVLCSLAKNGQTLRDVKQATDGCSVNAVLSSDVWSFEGEMLVTVKRRGWQTHVEAATKIPGQIFDWGKSSRCLERLLSDLHQTPD